MLASSEISGGDFFYDKGVLAEPSEGLSILGPAYTNGSGFIITDEPNYLYGPLNALLEASEARSQGSRWITDSLTMFDSCFGRFGGETQTVDTIWLPKGSEPAEVEYILVYIRTLWFKSDIMTHRGMRRHASRGCKQRSIAYTMPK